MIMASRMQQFEIVEFLLQKGADLNRKSTVSGLFLCLVGWLVGCLLVCLFACLLVCLFACLLVCLFACLLVCQNHGLRRELIAEIELDGHIKKKKSIDL